MKGHRFLVISVIAMIMVLAGISGLAPEAVAQETAEIKIDGGRTAWMLVSTALVLLMVPGLALFYGGMVRNKNMLNTMLLSLITMAVIGVEWVVLGYNMAFGTDHFGFVGWSPGGLVLSNIPWDKVMENGVPELVFVMFQGKFAIITPALISGAIVGRVKFSAYIVFTFLWAIFVYNPLAHMVWASGGYLFEKGVLDFAGGTVVHISAGVSALVLVIFFLKKRIGYPDDIINPGSLFLTLLGGSLLWVGWFGFNAGSAIAVSDIMTRAGIAFTTTQVAAASASLMWATIDFTRHRKVTGLGLASGMVAGLVAITPAAGHVSVGASIIIGSLAAVFCYTAVSMKDKFGYDDALDVFGVHGVGGLWGALATGLFVSIGSDLTRMAQFFLQVQGVVVAIIYAVVGTLIVGFITNLMSGGFRVSDREETLGLDLSQHGERGFQLY